MRRMMIAGAVAVCAAACSSPTADVRGTRADSLATTTTTTATPTTTSAPTDSAPSVGDDPTATSFAAEALMSVDATPDLDIWPLDNGPEAAVHALAPTADGWLAVGSLTLALQPGTAALWHVAADGTFGEPEALPTDGGGSPSVARDVVSVGNTTVVAGYQGAGQDAWPVVWRDGGDGAWTYSLLATDPGRVRGAIVDEVLALADGTIVVVGRGDGPFHATVVLWWSSDGGLTWSDFVPAGARSFLPPLVATDGSRIAMVLSTIPGDDGLAAFDTATIVWDATGPRLDSLQYIDPTPGERYWPRTLLWDGTAFVGGFQTEDQPVFATSADGVTYAVQDMTLPGLATSLPTNVEGMLLVDGAITVFIEQGDDVSAFRREGTELVRIDLPYVVAGDMAYLEGRELLATDGHRVGYLAVNWATKVFLGWDGATWTTRQVTEVPPHRNLVRDEVREIVTTGDSRMALLVQSVSDEPSHFAPGPGGVLWQRPGESNWMLLDIHGQIPVASAVAAWRGAFVIAGVDFDTNTTTLWQLDPNLGVFTQMSVIDGRITDLVSGAVGLVAKVAAAGGPSESSKTVWQSSDGVGWTQVELTGSPTGLCSDGVRVVAMWTIPDGVSDIVGLTEVGVRGAEPIGLSVTLEANQIADGWHESGRCGLNIRGVVSIHVGYEGALAELSPLSRSVPWTDGPNNPSNLTMNVTEVGSAEALIHDIAWTGREWVAVGSGHDAESSMDALLWRSDDGLVWQPGETIAGGPGNQEAWSVLVEDGQLLIGGLDVQQGRIWVLPA